MILPNQSATFCVTGFAGLTSFSSALARAGVLGLDLIPGLLVRMAQAPAYMKISAWPTRAMYAVPQTFAFGTRQHEAGTAVPRGTLRLKK